MTLPPPDPARHGGGGDEDGGGGLVPDLPAPVLGWRTWRVGRRAQRRAELIAPLAGLPWPPGRPMTASCGARGHTPPGDRCGCGLYALSDPGGLEWGPSDHEVLGVVALWGQVVEGTRGWRASHGYPRLVVTGPGIPAEQRAALARRYRIAVHGSEVPPRILAGLLGAEPRTAAVLRCGTDADVAALLDARMPAWVARRDARRADADAEPHPRRGILTRLRPGTSRRGGGAAAPP